MTTRKKDMAKREKSEANPKKKEKGNMPPTMTNDEIDFNEAEDFKLPSVGVHLGNLE